MASFTLGTAAQATGTAKSTILRAIKAGRLSATRDDTGKWCIDPAELARVFPLLAIPGATPEQPRTAQDAMSDMLISQLQGVIADMRQDRDHWRTAFEREQAAHAATQCLLPAPAATPIEQNATPAEAAILAEARATLERTANLPPAEDDPFTRPIEDLPTKWRRLVAEREEAFERERTRAPAATPNEHTPIEQSATPAETPRNRSWWRWRRAG